MNLTRICSLVRFVLSNAPYFQAENEKKFFSRCKKIERITKSTKKIIINSTTHNKRENYFFFPLFFSFSFFFFVFISYAAFVWKINVFPLKVKKKTTCHTINWNTEIRTESHKSISFWKNNNKMKRTKRKRRDDEKYPRMKKNYFGSSWNAEDKFVGVNWCRILMEFFFFMPMNARSSEEMI